MLTTGYASGSPVLQRHQSGGQCLMPPCQRQTSLINEKFYHLLLFLDVQHKIKKGGWLASEPNLEAFYTLIYVFLIRYQWDLKDLTILKTKQQNNETPIFCISQIHFLVQVLLSNIYQESPDP